MDGRVKTLHPLIFGGLLAKSDNSLHREQLAAQQIEPIGLVVVNLYPFQKTISQKEVKLEEAIENIDIGGPSLLRAAAKNYQDVVVVINPQDYPVILEELKKNNGEVSLDTKKKLAVKVFEHTSFYDGIITQYLRKNLTRELTSFPQTLNQGDPLSAYGSIIGINRIVGTKLADLINETPFVEAVLAPDFEDKALNILRQKKNRRLIKVGDLENRDVQIKDIKKIPGGFLVQDRNIKEITIKDLKVVTKRKPNKDELEELLFAWKVAKQVKSNAIVFTKNKQTVGVGAGQMSRVDAVIIAIRKSEGRSIRSCLASDAFFPFRDSIDEAVKAGVTAIIQPGGSKRDEEVIEAANEYNLAMVFTGARCFKH